MNDYIPDLTERYPEGFRGVGPYNYDPEYKAMRQMEEDDRAERDYYFKKDHIVRHAFFPQDQLMSEYASERFTDGDREGLFGAIMECIINECDNHNDQENASAMQRRARTYRVDDLNE